MLVHDPPEVVHFDCEGIGVVFVLPFEHIVAILFAVMASWPSTEKKKIYFLQHKFVYSYMAMVAAWLGFPN